MDDDLSHMTREKPIKEVKKLRQGIRQHRDSSRHELCWHTRGIVDSSAPTETSRTALRQRRYMLLGSKKSRGMARIFDCGLVVDSGFLHLYSLSTSQHMR